MKEQTRFAVYKKRRERLLQMMPENSIAIIPTAPLYVRNGDRHFSFRPDSSFFYLSGFKEPNALLALVSDNEPHHILFCEENDDIVEIWTGKRVGPENALSQFGFTETHSIRELQDLVPKFLLGKRHVYFRFGYPNRDREFFRWIETAFDAARGGLYPRVEDVQTLIGKMRLIKDEEELRTIRRAIEISAEGHICAMRVCRPDMAEYELAAELEYVFRSRGGDPSHAYETIVAGGTNACTLHYSKNNNRLKDGDLVLIDAGCEYDYYASDITRTFPVNGVFTAEQKALYEIVLNAQYAAIQEIRPGKPIRNFHDSAVREITKGLVKLRILTGDVDTLIRTREYQQFFMHGVGHFLGLDVHDVSDRNPYGRPEVFKPGMITTVEPGIYISPENIGVEKKWRGIGIRIEDDVLVTRDGCEVLSKNVPKTVEQIESFMKQQ